MVSYITCTDCESNKIRLRSHSSLSWFLTSHVRTERMIKYDWEAIQVCHGFMSRVRTVRTIKYVWEAIKVCHGFVCCVYGLYCKNDKIWLTSYSTFHMLRVQTVSVEGSMKWGKRDLDNEQNVTYVKKRETNEEWQTRLVNLCRHLHI